MAAVTIAREETRYFEFKIEGMKKLHKIPLAAYLPYGFTRRLLTVDSDQSFALALLHEFCPDLEQDERFTLGTAMAVYAEWEKASKQDGATVVESSALSEQ